MLMTADAAIITQTYEATHGLWCYCAALLVAMQVHYL